MIDYSGSSSQADAPQGTIELQLADQLNGDLATTNSQGDSLNEQFFGIHDWVDPTEMLYYNELYDDPAPANDIGSDVVAVPNGFCIEDYAGVELYIDPSTGLLSMTMVFERDDPTYAISHGIAGMDDGATGAQIDRHDDIDNARVTCTVTITRTVTQTSGSASLSGNLGIFGGSRSSGSTTTTTTTAVTLTGYQVNGRCYIPRGR